MEPWLLCFLCFFLLPPGPGVPVKVTAGSPDTGRLLLKI